MKHIFLFPIWLVVTLFLILAILILAPFRKHIRVGQIKELWEYKLFVRAVMEKSKA